VNSDFLTYLNKEVAAIQKRWVLEKSGQALMLWYAREAVELEEQTALEAVSTEGGNDKGIDLFHVDDANERVIIGQGKYQRNGSYNAKKTELLGLIHSTDWLKNTEDLRREGRPELVAASEEYLEAIAKNYGVDYHYVFTGNRTKDASDQAELFNKEHVSASPAHRATLVDLATLRSIHDEMAGVRMRIDAATMRLAKDCFYPQSGKYGQALVATVPAAELVSLYTQHGDALFARNVRLFLATRVGGVNAGIRDTLESEQERGNFWAYNNGITIVCDSYHLDRANSVVDLKNFSVVNGCQTTVSLANAPTDAQRKAEVLVRIISAPERLVDNVIFFTNSQTPVRAPELRSQDKRQKNLKRQMAEEPNPYYYCLRKGELRTLTPVEKKKFTRDGSLQVIQRDDLVQCLGAFRGFPYVAYKDKGKLYSSNYEKLFPLDLRVEEALLAWRAGVAAAQQIEKSRLQVVDSLDSFLLKRGGRLFVVSVMSMLLSHRNGSKYLTTLKRDAATSKTTAIRLATYAQVATTLYLMASRRMVGDGGIEKAASVLRTQESYPELKRAIDDEWQIRVIEKSWVDALPKF